jgi:hypothetical protein
VFVVLGIQRAMPQLRITMCGLSGCPVFFHSILINGTIFEKKKKLLNIKCVFLLSLQLLSATFLILRRTDRLTVNNVYWSSRKVPVILVLTVSTALQYVLFYVY